MLKVTVTIGVLGLAIWVGYATSVYPKKRVASWVEICTDGLAPDWVANDAQATLGAIWSDGFGRGMVDRTGVIEAVAEYLKGAGPEGQKDVLELAAGQGTTSLMWARTLRAKGVDARFLLTDLQPDLPRWRAFTELERVEAPVDATNASALARQHVPGWGQGKEVRTIHFALHHLHPDVARGVIADAVGSGAALLVGDLKPCAGGLLWNGVLAWKYFFMTFAEVMGRNPLKLALLPALPLVLFGAWHDATVSVLRAYSDQELQGFLSSVPGGSGYEVRTFSSASFGEWIGLPSVHSSMDDPVVRWWLATPKA